MRKTINFGKVDYLGNGRRNCPVTVEIELRERGGEPTFTIDPKTKERHYTGNTTPKYTELSICGTIWNHMHTDCYTAGQCLDTIARYVKAPLFKELFRFWNMYHLNGMHAGTPEQEKAVEEWKARGNRYDYTAVCEHLKAIGLHEVEHNGKPYRYGTAWLHQEIPADDLARIRYIIDHIDASGAFVEEVTSV